MLKICIDPGHTQNANKGVVSGYYEGNMTLDLAQRLKAALEKYAGVQVYLTRTKATQNPTLTTRGKTAGNNGCRLFLSLHSDASSRADARGVTVIRSLQRPASVALGKKLVKAVTGCMGAPFSFYGGSDEGVWTKVYPGTTSTDYYGVIRSAVTSATVQEAYLIEHSFHTNATDCAWLDKSANRQRLAEVEAATIAAYYGLQLKQAAAEQPAEGKYYRVQVGAFLVKSRAYALQAELEKKGFSTYVKKAGVYWRVQVGAYRYKSGAQETVDRLQDAGYSPIITEG